MKLKVITIVAVVVASLLSARLFFLGKKSQSNFPELGHSEGKLTPCPDKPNCVSSQNTAQAMVLPLDGELSLDELKKIVLSMKGAKLEKEGGEYLRFSFKSDVFGFVDDLELLKADQLWHIRSSSRVGYSDMNTNRESVEKLRSLTTRN